MKKLFLPLICISMFLSGCATQTTNDVVPHEEMVKMRLELEDLKRTLAYQEEMLGKMGIEIPPPSQEMPETPALSEQASSQVPPQTPQEKTVPPVQTSAPVTTPALNPEPTKDIQTPQNTTTALLPTDVIVKPEERLAVQSSPIVLQPKTVNNTDIENKIKNSKESQAYDTALSYYRTGKFQEAEKAFDVFMATFPESSYVPNALYWKGESFYARGMYPEAIMAFKDVQARFPKHIKSADALLKTALSYKKINDLPNAALHTTVLYEDWPDSDAAKRAKALNLTTL